MNSPEEKPYGLTTTASGGLIRRMDQRLELVNRLMIEIQAKQTGLIDPKTLEVPLGSGVVMLMKWCPAGSFLMGSPQNEEMSLGGQVQVTLSKGFWMAQTQVTQAQWQALMGNNPSFFRGENLPVENVCWDDAQEFLTKLNAIVGYSDGLKMVLPTEAQWEYAGRAGETGPFSGGTVEEVAWYANNSGGETHEVGTKRPNAWGLHDMHGNVWELCEDWYEDELKGGVDPQGGDASDADRVVRGGSWSNGGFACRVANRSSYCWGDLNFNYGFRVARSSIP
jgi:formylglycine-generating enzyme required for sulfatase activity